MEFIEAHWYIWLVVMVTGYGFALASQIGRMKRVMKSMDSPSFGLDDAGTAFFEGMGKMVVAGAVGSGGMALLVISIILNIIHSSG